MGERLLRLSTVSSLFLISLLLLGLAIPTLVIWAQWQGHKGEWARYSPAQRRQFRLTVAIVAPIILAVAVALIVIDPLER
jgi:O-antigen ligase